MGVFILSNTLSGFPAVQHSAKIMVHVFSRDAPKFRAFLAALILTSHCLRMTRVDGLSKAYTEGGRERERCICIYIYIHVLIYSFRFMA